MRDTKNSNHGRGTHLKPNASKTKHTKNLSTKLKRSPESIVSKNAILNTFSPPSSPSISSIPSTPPSEQSDQHSLVFEQTRALTSALYSKAHSRAKSRDSLVDQMIDTQVDTLFRSKLVHHRQPSSDVQDDIVYRAKMNNISVPLYALESNKTLKFESLKDSSFSTEGMIPFLSPGDQLAYLRAKEKVFS